MIESILSGEYLVLARDCEAVGVHGVTGRDVDEGTLVAGTRVREVVTREEQDPSGDGTRQVTTFQASTDGGKTWYDQRTMEDPVDLVTWAGRLRTTHVDGETGDKVD